MRPGYDKAPRQDSTGKGCEEEEEEETKHVHRGKLNKRNICPTSVYIANILAMENNDNANNDRIGTLFNVSMITSTENSNS